MKTTQHLRSKVRFQEWEQCGQARDQAWFRVKSQTWDQVLWKAWEEIRENS